jgi:hypothetical protein
MTLRELGWTRIAGFRRGDEAAPDPGASRLLAAELQDDTVRISSAAPSFRALFETHVRDEFTRERLLAYLKLAVGSTLDQIMDSYVPEPATA